MRGVDRRVGHREGAFVATPDGLREIVLAGQRAEQAARALVFQDAEATRAALQRTERELARTRAALRHPDPLAPAPSPAWQRRLDDATAQIEELPAGHTEDDVARPDERRRQADADTAVALARLAVLQASAEVLRGWSADLAEPPERTAVPVVQRARTSTRELPRRVASTGRGAAASTRREIGIVLGDRKILMKLVISFAIGLATLAFVISSSWDDNVEQAPYLALLALSGVIGGVVCTNSLAWDARRVRDATSRGRRLGRLLISKNLALFLVVGLLGVVLAGLLAWASGSTDTLVSALGELVTMMLVWLGVGNVLSVVSPLRVEPLKARFADGTWKPFLFSFASSYVIGLGVNGVLTWKVWAKRSMADELGGAWVPVVGLIFSSFVLWALLTALAVSLADHPRVRRGLRTEVVDTKAAAAPAAV